MTPVSTRQTARAGMGGGGGAVFDSARGSTHPRPTQPCRLRVFITDAGDGVVQST